MFAESDLVMDDPDHRADFSDRSAVRWHIAQYWTFYRRHLPEMVVLRQAAMANPVFGRRLQEMATADGAHLIGHLEPVCAAGIPLPGEPDVVASAVHSLLGQFAYTWLAAGGDGTGREISDEEAIETLTEFVHRGLAGTPPAGVDQDR